MMGFLQKLKRVLPGVIIFMSYGLNAQVTLPATSPYSQDFNTIPGASGTSYPQGWIAYDGTTADNTMMAGSTATTTTGGNHNYGSKIGLLASGSYSAPLYINLALANTTGKTGLKISYNVIKMREQGRNNSFNLEISTTSPTTGFTAVAGGTYDSGSIAQGTVTPYTNLDISTLDNTTGAVYIRWAYEEIGGSGSRDGIALDDVVVSWTQAPTVPNAPVATAATNIASTGFTANWNAVANATGYRLDVSTDNAFTNILEDYDNIAVAGLSKQVTLGIQLNTTYYYRVRAEQGAETSVYSNIITVATPQPPLAAPVATPATGILSAEFTANWDAVDGATGYYLDVSTSADFGTTQPGVIITETFENMPAPNAAPSTTVWTGDGGITWTATQNRTDRVISTTTDRLLCLFESVPADDAYLESGVITGGLTNITFDAWKVLNNGLYSTLTVYVLSGPGFATQTTIGSIDTPSSIAKNVFNSGPITGITGDYKIRIEVTANYESTPGNKARSGINNLTFGANEIVIPLFVTGFDGLDAGNITSYQVTGLDPNTVYYYRVRAYTADQTSVNSNTIQVQTECIPVAVPEVTPLAFCGNATVAELTVTTGTGLTWYADATTTTSLDAADVLATGSYYVSQTVNSCESDRAEVMVTVNTVPDAPETTPLTFCGSATVAELTVTTGAGLTWYADATTTMSLDAADVLATGSYYVSQTDNGCESARAEVMVTVNTIPDAPAVSNTAQTFCSGATVGELSPATAEYTWYASADATTALTADEVLANGLSVYYVSQSVNGCESTERTAVAVMVNVTPEPVAEPLTTCQNATVADLEATGTDLKWYADATTTTALTGTEVLTSGSYYVTQTLNNCESARTEVVVTVSEPIITGAAVQEFDVGDTLADLEVTGTDVLWYADGQLTQLLPDTTPLVDEATYYAVSVMGECTSDALAVTVNEILGTEGFDTANLSYYPNPVLDILHINYTEAITSVTVYNLLGQPVLVAKPNAANVRADMSSLAEGAYIVQLAAGDKTQTFKVIKH